MKSKAWIAAALLVCLGSGSGCSRAPKDEAYVREVQEWHQRRIERLKQPDGWLSLVGLFWMKPGENRFGSDPSNDLVFPAKAPEFIGSYFVQDSIITVRVREGVPVRSGDSLVREMQVQTDRDGSPTILRLGTLSWYVIERGGKYAVRLKDSESPARLGFTGIDRFPIDARWRVKARFEAYPEPKKIPVATVVGTTETMTSPGKLVFQIAGKTYSLEAFREEGEDQLFLVFGDRTNGKETYGAGRFLYVDLPKEDGTTWIDFNKAYNPPCAFTPYATCPLPPDQNLLPLRVTAGEKRYGKGH